MIRQATVHDLEALKQIKAAAGLDVSQLGDLQYKLKIQKQGFLLKAPSYTQQMLDNDLQNIYLVYEDMGKVVGYIRIAATQEIDKTVEVNWFRPELRDQYFLLPHADIGGIATLPETGQKGIATALLNSAIVEIKKKQIPYLFSFVVISPVTNIPSILFHEKNEFQRLALVNEPEFYELKKYQSFLYGRKL